MSKIKIILFIIMLTGSTLIHAETCQKTNDGFPFRQVIIDTDYGDGRCDYGPAFDFSHSYSLKNVTPESGPWQGSSEPFTIFCKGLYSDCVFKIKTK